MFAFLCMFITYGMYTSKMLSAKKEMLHTFGKECERNCPNYELSKLYILHFCCTGCVSFGRIYLK
jgi:hypothetical protein